LSMSRETFMKIDGFKQKLSDKIYDGIQDKFNHASLPVLMEATNIFGRGFGKKKFQMILHAIPDIIISHMSNQDKTLAVSKISGMAINTAEKFIDKLSEFKDWAKMVGIEHKLRFTPIQVTEHASTLSGKRIVLTGFRDKYITEKIEQHGATICSSITKLTDMVIVKDLDHQSHKTQLAKSLEIPILSCEEFIMKYILS
jgi:DNA ligase (NAD+)